MKQLALPAIEVCTLVAGRGRGKGVRGGGIGSFVVDPATT